MKDHVAWYYADDGGTGFSCSGDRLNAYSCLGVRVVLLAGSEE